MKKEIKVKQSLMYHYELEGIGLCILAIAFVVKLIVIENVHTESMDFFHSVLLTISTAMSMFCGFMVYSRKHEKMDEMAKENYRDAKAYANKITMNLLLLCLVVFFLLEILKFKSTLPLGYTRNNSAWIEIALVLILSILGINNIIIWHKFASLEKE